jgi:hypothetical protein
MEAVGVRAGHVPGWIARKTLSLRLVMVNSELPFQLNRMIIIFLHLTRR